MFCLKLPHLCVGLCIKYCYVVCCVFPVSCIIQFTKRELGALLIYYFLCIVCLSLLVQYVDPYNAGVAYHCVVWLAIIVFLNSD